MLPGIAAVLVVAGLWASEPTTETSRRSGRLRWMRRRLEALHDPHAREQAPRLRICEVEPWKAVAYVQPGPDEIVIGSSIARLPEAEAWAIVAHEYRHTRQAWLEWLFAIELLAMTLLLGAVVVEPSGAALVGMVGVGVAALAVEWALARFSEVDADAYACEAAGGASLARALQRIERVEPDVAQHYPFACHPPLHDRVERADASLQTDAG